MCLGGDEDFEALLGAWDNNNQTLQSWLQEYEITTVLQQL